MIKSSSLVFVLLFAFLFHLETFSLRLIGVIVLICLGVLLMVATETQFVLGGFILCLSGSALAGLRWSMTQLLLKNKKLGLDHPVATIFWLSPIMGVTLIIVSAVLDHWSDLAGSRFFDSVGATIKTCFLLTLPGVLAFCMTLSEYLYVFCCQTYRLWTEAGIIQQHNPSCRCCSDVHRWNSQRGVYHHTGRVVLWGRAHSLEYHWCCDHRVW